MTLKHILTFSSAIALSTLYLCSCAGEDGPDFTDSRELQISGTFVGERAPQSRVNGSLWEADTIGVYITAPFSYAIVKDYQNLPYYTTSTGTTAIFTKIGKAIAVSDLTAVSNSIIAYAPYTPNDPSRIDNSTFGIAINTRKQNTRELQRKIDIVRVQKGIQADWISSGKIDNLVFSHQMSKIVIKIKADPAMGITLDDITKAECTLGGLQHDDINFSTTRNSFNFDNRTPINDWSLKDNTIQQVIDNATEQAVVYTAIVAPQTVSGSDLTLTINGKTYQSNGSLFGVLKRNRVYTYTVTIKPSELSLIATQKDWDDGGEHFAEL